MRQTPGVILVEQVQVHPCRQILHWKEVWIHLMLLFLLNPPSARSNLPTTISFLFRPPPALPPTIGSYFIKRIKQKRKTLNFVKGRLIQLTRKSFKISVVQDRIQDRSFSGRNRPCHIFSPYIAIKLLHASLCTNLFMSFFQIL